MIISFYRMLLTAYRLIVHIAHIRTYVDIMNITCVRLFLHTLLTMSLNCVMSPTASHFHLFHSGVMVAVGGVVAPPICHVANALLQSGTILFSGSLYASALKSDPKYSRKCEPLLLCRSLSTIVPSSLRLSPRMLS